jgi:solute carrier family 25 phosphate transporter 23/24/25/41
MHIPLVSQRRLNRKGRKCANNFSDVLRRRFQINTMSGMGYQYKSIFDAVKIIVAQEGIAGMYKGIVPNLLKVAPSMASSWLSFEMTRDFLLTLRADTPNL